MTKYFSQSQSKNKLSVKIFKYEDLKKMFVMFGNIACRDDR